MSFRLLLAAAILLVAEVVAAAPDLDRAYDSALSGPRDQATAKLLPFARAGDPLAQWYLVDFLVRAEDYAGALSWLRKAADAGLPQAQEELGDWYSQGYKVPKDQAQGQLWYSKAIAGYQSLVDLGDLWAASRLGQMYYSGDAGEVKMVNALPIWRQCAKQGDARCQSQLASALDSSHSAFPQGVGSPLDNKEAAFWWGELLKSADQKSGG